MTKDYEIKEGKIIRYVPVPVKEPLRALSDNDGNPVSGFAFRDNEHQKWRPLQLAYVAAPHLAYRFLSGASMYRHCARVETIDPRRVPEGVPELPEPFLAYVSWDEIKRKGLKGYEGKSVWFFSHGYKWSGGRNFGFHLYHPDAHYAIDVRTAFSERHFPEYVEAVGYVQPSPIAKGHNPDRLTEDEVGVSDGWRLLSEDERMALYAANYGVPADLQMFLQVSRRWAAGAYGTHLSYTYRTRKPEGYFLVPPETRDEDRAIMEAASKQTVEQSLKALRPIFRAGRNYERTKGGAE